MDQSTIEKSALSLREHYIEWIVKPNMPCWVVARTLRSVKLGVVSLAVHNLPSLIKVGIKVYAV